MNKRLVFEQRRAVLTQMGLRFRSAKPKKSNMGVMLETIFENSGLKFPRDRVLQGISAFGFQSDCRVGMGRNTQSVRETLAERNGKVHAAQPCRAKLCARMMDNESESHGFPSTISTNRGETELDAGASGVNQLFNRGARSEVG